MKNKTLIVYSSITGNTEKIARAIYEALEFEADIFHVKENPDWTAYENIIIGYWARRAGADYQMRDYMSQIRDKNCGIFATCGTYDNSDHAKKVLNYGIELLEGNNNRVSSSFICQGRINRTKNMIHKVYPEGHPYHLDETTRKRHLSAYNRPNEEDIRKAKEAFKNFK